MSKHEKQPQHEGPKHAYDYSDGADNLTVSKIKSRLFDEHVKDTYETALDATNDAFRDVDGKQSMDDQFASESAEFDRIVKEYGIPTPENIVSETSETGEEESFDQHAENNHTEAGDPEEDTADDAGDKEKTSHDTPEEPGNYYGLTAEEFTALKALRNQFPHINNENVAVDHEEINSKLDELEDAFDEFNRDDAEVELDELEDAVDRELAPAAAAERKQGWIKRNIDRVRTRAKKSRERAAGRKSFKESFKEGFRQGREKIANSKLKPSAFFGKIMSRFNRNKHIEEFEHQDIIQYGDGQMSLLFQVDGDKTPLGPHSIHKYARDFSGLDAAIITAASGEQYGLSNGYVINKRTGEAFELPHEMLNLTVGKKAELPGIGPIGLVQSVQLQYKVGAPNDRLADIQSTGPSPFLYYEQIAKDQNR